MIIDNYLFTGTAFSGSLIYQQTFINSFSHDKFNGFGAVFFTSHLRISCTRRFYAKKAVLIIGSSQMKPSLLFDASVTPSTLYSIDQYYQKAKSAHDNQSADIL